MYYVLFILLTEVKKLLQQSISTISNTSQITIPETPKVKKESVELDEDILALKEQFRYRGHNLVTVFWGIKFLSDVSTYEAFSVVCFIESRLICRKYIILCTNPFQAQWSTERCPASGSFRLENPVGKAVVSIWYFIIPLSNNYRFIKTGKLTFSVFSISWRYFPWSLIMRYKQTAIWSSKWESFKEVVIRVFRNHMQKEWK